MKKSTLIITETILSLVLAASIGSATVLTMDIRSGGKIIPQEFFQFSTSGNQKSKNETPSAAETKPAESSVASEAEINPASSCEPNPVL